MNILIITRYNNDGGVVTHVINLANELTAMGHQVAVMAPNDIDGTSGRYQALNCIWIPTNFETYNFMRVWKKISWAIKEYEIDIIHSHNRNISLYAKLANILKKTPFVWTLHLNNIPCGMFHKLLTFSGNRTITVSTELKDFCVKKLKVKEDKCRVVSNGIWDKRYIQYTEEQKSEIRKKWNINKDDKIIVMLSRLEPRKGHMLLLEAVSMLSIESDFKILITGKDLDDGSYRNEIKQYIEKNGMSSKVQFIGYVDPVEVLNISDVMVLPSDNEGQSISIIESFMMKVPVVRTKTGGYEDMKHCCIGIDVGSADQLRKSLEQIFKKDVDVDEMIVKAYKFAHENCTCTAMANNVLGVYKEAVLENNR